jgi:5-methylcytosine-specific restriction endonuclease McrBC regulatory subunit McrC
MSRSSVRYGDTRTFSVPERGEVVIEDCPDDIQTRLERASFERVSPNVFVKHQGSFEGNAEYKVVEATLRGNDLYVEASDIVGVVSLTPSDSLRIDPKIEWDHIFDIVLAVQGKSRSMEYHGVPLNDFVSGDIDLSDVFVILAINYLEGVEDIKRNGYLRDLVTTRSDLDHVRGKIDFSRTLMNRAEGSTQIHCLQKEVEHDNVANSLLHYAGKVLLRLFRQNAEEYDHPAYDGVFSQVHREVERLEEMGVTSGVDRLREYKRFSIHQLPRERGYYKRAIDISKSIATSSLGQQMEEGRERIIVDYVLNMESLFEDYSQVVIEEELEKIRSYDVAGQTENVVSVGSRSVKPFSGESGVYHQPDHVVEDGGEVVAVLDSKYYGEGHDPVTDGAARSRLFSYAYLLDCDRMAYLCPLQEEQSRTVDQTGAELRVVTPETFSLDRYQEAIYEYLYDVLVERYPLLEVFRSVEENHLCLDQADVRDLRGLDSVSGSREFRIDNVRNFSLRVVKAAANDLSFKILNKSDLEQNGDWTRDKIEDLCEEYQGFGNVRCVPVFVRDEPEEFIRLYFIEYTGSEVEVTREEVPKLL